MRIFVAFFLLLLFSKVATSQTPFTAPWGFNYSAPTSAPSSVGTRVRFDITTGRIYTWSPDALNWQLQGYNIDQISGTGAPSYAPVRGQSWFAVNGDTLPRLYQYLGSGTNWKCLNCSGGTSYIAGTGITISGNVITNNLPDQTVVITGASGTYPNFSLPDASASNELNTGFDVSGGNLRIIDAGATRTVPVTAIAPDQSATNEIQQIDTFSISAGVLSLSLSSDNLPAKTVTLPVSGITSLNAQTGATQTFATGSTGTDFSISSASNTHTFNLPNASSTVRGALSSADWTAFNSKVSGSGTTGFLPIFTASGTIGNSSLNENVTDYITSTTRGISIGDLVSSGAGGFGYRLQRGSLTGSLATNGSQLLFQTSSSHDLSFGTNSIERMHILANGNIGIGTTSPTEKLDISNGNILLDAGRRLEFRSGSYVEADGASSLFTLRGLANFFIQGGNLLISSSSVAQNSKLKVIGAGATLATTNFLFQNSAENTIIAALDNGYIRIGNAGLTSSPRLYSGSDASSGDVDINGQQMIFNSRISNTPATTGAYQYTGIAFSHSSGNQIVHRISRDINFTTGSASAAVSNVNYRINTSGAQTGSVTGLLITSTEIALNGISNNLIDCQVGGASKIKINSAGEITMDATYTAPGTTGAQTINKPSGTVNMAAGGTSLTVTNSLVTTQSIITAVVQTNDATATIKNVVPNAGSFTINLNTAATSETKIGFVVFN